VSIRVSCISVKYNSNALKLFKSLLECLALHRSVHLVDRAHPTNGYGLSRQCRVGNGIQTMVGMSSEVTATCNHRKSLIDKIHQ